MDSLVDLNNDGNDVDDDDDNNFNCFDSSESWIMIKLFSMCIMAPCWMHKSHGQKEGVARLRALTNSMGSTKTIHAMQFKKPKVSVMLLLLSLYHEEGFVSS